MNNFLLTDHFSFFELTDTSNLDLLEQNRKEATLFLDALRGMAIMLEQVRPITGPLMIHSGFRCPTLNGATVGSAKTSQHMKGQAVDFSRPGESSPEEVDALFKTVLEACIESGIHFGQLIKESARRAYGQANWVHLSLGDPWREIERCGQVLVMQDGVYTPIKTVPFGR